MAAQLHDEKTPNSLEEAQDFIFAIMEDIENIWGKLRSQEWPAHVKSQGEYEQWHMKASAAKRHKEKRLSWLQDFCRDNFAVYYTSKRSLMIAMQERELQTPDFLRDEIIESSNGHAPFLAEKAALQHLREALIEDKPQRPEISLSLQSQKHLELIMQRLLLARQSAELTQTEVSEMLGFESNVLGGWERGRVSPTLVNIFRLCAIYQVDPVAILTGESSASREDLELILQQFEAGRDYLKGLLGE